MAEVAFDVSEPASPLGGIAQQVSRPNAPDGGKPRVFISYSRDDLDFADRLSAAPIRPASAIIASTAGNPPSAKAVAPPATPTLPPRKVQALTMPEPCPACAGESADSASRGAKA